MPDKKTKRPATICAYTERIPDNLLLEPIEYIFGDHFRQVDMCLALEGLAKMALSSPPDPETAQTIHYSLGSDLKAHLADEEVDLLPALSARAQPEDNFPKLLSLLHKEHVRDYALADEVLRELDGIIQGGALKNPEHFQRAASNLADFHLNHMHWENAVVIPLARRLLTSEDLEAMGRNMAKRRDIVYPGD